MKFTVNHVFLSNILVVFLAILLFTASAVAQGEKSVEAINNQLQILVSSENPDANSIREVQQLLVELGLDPGPIDGMLGPKTRAALNEWKESSGSKVSNAWIVPKKKAVTDSGWKCVSREKFDSHMGPGSCIVAAGEILKNITQQVGYSGINYYKRNGSSIPPPTRKCSECEIYID